MYAVVLLLRPRAPAPPPSGRHLHAAFLRLLAAGDPVLAEQHHGGNQVRPYTVALVPPHQAPVGATPLSPGRFTHQRNSWQVTPPAPNRDDLLLRCTFLDVALHATFIRGIPPTAAATALRLGSTTYEVQDVTTDGPPGNWSGQTTWDRLAADATPAPAITLEFATPTCFSRGDVDGRKRVELFPLPAAVWESWARKWSAFAPQPLDIPAVAADAAHWLQVADYTLETRTLDFGRHQQKGYLGQVRFELHPATPDDIARRLNLLADFSFYAGTGYKTTMGLGLTRRIAALPRT